MRKGGLQQSWPLWNVEVLPAEATAVVADSVTEAAEVKTVGTVLAKAVRADTGEEFQLLPARLRHVSQVEAWARRQPLSPPFAQSLHRGRQCPPWAPSPPLSRRRYRRTVSSCWAERWQLRRRRQHRWCSVQAASERQRPRPHETATTAVDLARRSRRRARRLQGSTPRRTRCGSRCRRRCPRPHPCPCR